MTNESEKLHNDYMEAYLKSTVFFENEKDFENVKKILTNDDIEYANDREE